MGRLRSIVTATAFVAMSVGATAAYAVPNSAIVVDAKNGKVLYSSNPDSARFPASLTKMMTLYLLFEALDAGKVSLTTQLPVSQYAAAQAPTKLGIPAGSTIAVKDAILAVVTRSANDMAVAIGEYLGGSETAFATKMTAKAHAIGMAHTTFRNASGLPNPGQMTTARDMATLGRTLEMRYPKYFVYFSTPVFTFKGQRIANHNHLLGRVAGINGIKTGYTRASGYNLVTSVNRDGRQIVAVVMGGATGGARDRQMVSLISSYMAKASIGPSTAPVADDTAVADASDATPDPTPAPVAAAQPVKTASAKNAKDAIAELVPSPRLKPVLADAADQTGTVTAYATDDQTTDDPQPQADEQSQPLAAGQETKVSIDPARFAEAEMQPAPKPGTVAYNVVVAAKGPATEEDQSIAQGDTGDDDPAVDNSARKIIAVSSGWKIQVAATPSKDAAVAMLDNARTKAARIIGDRKGYTEAVVKEGVTLFRARFAGFDTKEQARAACTALNKQNLDCLALQ